MAMQAGGLIQDQNSIHYDGALPGRKIGVSKAQEKGRFVERKAFNDISNSGRPSILQTPNNQNSSKALVSENLHAGGRKALGDLTNSEKPRSRQASNKTQDNKRLNEEQFLQKRVIPVNVPKASEKVQSGGRKVLGDLTNSEKPNVLHQEASKKSENKKLSTKEQTLLSDVAEEHFLHNHEECIKAQKKTVDMDYFLKTIGLDNDSSIQLVSPVESPFSTSLKLESSFHHLEMAEMPDFLLNEEMMPGKLGSPLPSESPKSPKSYNWEDHSILDFKLVESPKACKQ